MPAFDRTTLETLTADAPAQRAARMRHGFDIFEKSELPTASEENWKYVELDLDLASLELASDPGPPLPRGAFLGAIAQPAGRAVIIDGTVVELEGGEGVEIRRVRDMADEDHLFELVAADHDLFAAARTAFATDGVVVSVPRNTVVDRPVVIDVQATSAAASFPVISVDLGANAEASVVVVYRSPNEVAALVSPQVGLHAGDGARLKFLAIQNFGLATTAVIHQRATVGRDASARIGEVGLGGILGRLDLGVLLEGAGGSAEVIGLNFGEYDQTLDYRMVITHRGRNTSSNVFLKGAVEDNARSVFTGLLKIEKDAIRSSAFETNRNLVLSEGAQAHSVPNLEILCDDVVCGHGSSVGPLEEEHLYYLQSRGLSTERAERLLVRGFFNEVIDKLPVPGLAEPILDEVFSRFLEAQAEGRLA